MENAQDIKSKSVDFVLNVQKFICCRLVFFDISKRSKPPRRPRFIWKRGKSYFNSFPCWSEL